MHEAAHGIIAAALGGIVHSTDTFINGHTLGTALYVRPDNPVHACAATVAGCIAEWEADGRAHQCFRGFAGDRKYLHEHLSEVYAEQGRTFAHLESTAEFQAGLKLANELVGRYWGAIEHLAGRLLTNEYVSGRIVHALVLAHDRKRSP
jgi:hypothetical protein